MVVTQDLLNQIKQHIDSAELGDSPSEKGTILEIKDWVATVDGLTSVGFGEIVRFENWTDWLVLDLLDTYVWVLILWDYAKLSQGDLVEKTGTVYTIPVGD